MGNDIKISAIATQCRAVLASMSVTGVTNARILTAVYDDLGIIEQYLLGEDKARERRAENDPEKDDKRDV